MEYTRESRTARLLVAIPFDGSRAEGVRTPPLTFGIGDFVSRLAIFAANCAQSAESDPTQRPTNPCIGP